MTAQSKISIRDLSPDDDKTVKQLAVKCFPSTQANFVRPGDAGGIVAEVDGSIAAVSLLRIITLSGERKAGFIAWLMTDPDYRSLGLASRLVKESIRKLEKLECDDILTDVEGYNTGSANIFHASGFERIGLNSQLKRWTFIDLLRIWIRTGFVVDPGHFLWVYGARPRTLSQNKQRLITLLLNWLLAVLALTLGGGIFLSGTFGFPGMLQMFTLAFGIASVFAIREGIMRLVFRRQIETFEFRTWKGGIGISLIIALLFGRLLPLPGNLYPAGDGWKTKNYRKMYGRAAIINTLTLSVLILASSWAGSITENSALQSLFNMLLFVAKPLLLFDTVIAIAPFDAFNATRLKNYNVTVWLILSVLAVVIFLFG